MKDDRKELEETKKQNGSGDDENIVMGNSEIPKSLEEVIDTIPDKEQASVIRRVMSMQFGMISNTPENSISKKIKLYPLSRTF